MPPVSRGCGCGCHQQPHGNGVIPTVLTISLVALWLGLLLTAIYTAIETQKSMDRHNSYVESVYREQKLRIQNTIREIEELEKSSERQ